MLLNNDLGIADVADCIVVSMRPDLGDEGMQQLMQALSQRLMLGRQHAVLLDFSGVMLLDHHEFRQVHKLAEVCRLLGAVCLLVGLNAGIAAFLALADAEPGPLRCFLDMDDAFAHVRTTLKDEE
ncbi:anti-anti-sigma factor [Aeromonas hydrophila]|uniref:anti-anti-sigma factor n=1 Tax=Aeromonas hydrophila TaxID=644 RepID=UPI001F4BEEE2|nr:anti-anti-sigma factor [Aeromonas hydrophila]MCO4198088.1 anti-anti-sigma factor [Aeromonas hydrophila]UNB58199.1 anti-anti-sigma factor [Aeromonas hydrophila]